MSYNTADYLEKSLESLLNQSLQEIEIITIDNGSSDHSRDILQKYARKDQRVIYHNIADSIGVQEIRGISNSTNYTTCLDYGFAIAKGEYLYVLDADDWLDSHALETLYSTASEKNLDVLSFNTTIEFENESAQIAYAYYHHYYKRTLRCEEVLTGKEFMSLCKKNHQYVPNIFLYIAKRSFVQENAIKHYYYGSDTLLTFTLFLVAKRVSLHRESVHHYLMRGKSGTQLQSNESAYLAKKNQMTYTAMLTTFYYHFCSKEQDIYLYRILENVLSDFWKNAKKSNPEGYLEEVSILRGYETMLLGTTPPKIHHSKEELLKKIDETTKICLFGPEVTNKLALTFFQEQGLEPPCAICDNNHLAHGSLLEGYTVLSYPQVLEKYGELQFLVTDQEVPRRDAIFLQIADTVGFDSVWYCSF